MTSPESHGGLLRDKLRQFRLSLRSLPRGIALVHRAVGGLLTGWVLTLILQGMIPAAVVQLTRHLVDTVVAAGRSGAASWAEYRPAIWLAVLVAALLILVEIARGAADWLRTKMTDLVQQRMSLEVHHKSVAVDLAFYDLPDYYDHLHRAQTEAYERPMRLLDGLGSILRHGVTLVTLMAVLVSVHWLLPMALLLGALPVLFVALAHTYRLYRWRLETTPERRRCWYFDWVLTGSSAAAELRLFDAGERFSTAFQDVRTRLRERRLELLRTETTAFVLAVIASWAVAGAAVAWTVAQAVAGALTLGALVLVLQSVAYSQRLLRDELRNLGELYSSVLFLSALFQFLDLESTVTSPAVPAPTPEGRPLAIEVCDLSFAYPGSDSLVLDTLALSLPAGRTTALVGRNGAGKSTLLKLLCRFYDPLAGSIRIGGVDIKELDLSQVRGLITALFQEPMQYSATVTENIALGARGTAPASTEIEQAARAAGLDKIIDDLPAGLDTLLGTWFPTGQALSFGQWQKVALARAFVRDAPIILLDEPTSAMDPWAEREWMRRFQEHASGRTALIITHRLTTAMRADLIHVLDGGRLAESGSHKELMARSGLYADSWQRQGLQPDGSR